MHPSASSLPFLLIPLFVAGMLAYYVLSYRRGWAVLARLYPGPPVFAGEKRASQYGIVGGMALQNCLEAGADHQCLYLSVPGLLPPLLIPWGDITVTPRKGLLTGNLAFQFRRAPAVTLTLGETLARELLRARPPA